jgi:hypothetical protein
MSVTITGFYNGRGAGSAACEAIEEDEREEEASPADKVKRASSLQDYSGSYYGSNYVSFGYSITTIVTRVVIFCGRVGFSQG